jgi:membrane associated rhomboid family serine protease
MGESDRHIEYKDVRPRKAWLGMEGNALVSLLALNAIFTLLMLVLEVSFYVNEKNSAQFNQSVLHWMVVPDGLSLWIQRPWTILTYMFTDAGSNVFIRLIANMLWLWTFGFVFQQRAGNSKLIPLYLYAGLGGGLFFLFFNTVSGNWLIGAQVAVFGVSTAAVVMAPNHKIMIQVRNGFPLWSLYIIYVIFNSITITAYPISLGSALLGSGLFGAGFVWLLKRGIDAGSWMNVLYDKIVFAFSPPKKPSKSEMRNQIFYKTGNRPPFETFGNPNQKRIDEILDKINTEGFDKLTDAEKEILRKASENE